MNEILKTNLFSWPEGRAERAVASAGAGGIGPEQKDMLKLIKEICKWMMAEMW